MKTKTIKQTATFHAKPKEVYELIMDAKKHSAFTGTKVKMSNKINGKFEVFDGYCHGYNIELKEGKKIVQAWHFAEKGWPEDHFSTCIFVFTKIKDGTRLSFIQKEVPEHKYESLKSGWKEFYWAPMKEYLQSSSKIKKPKSK
jgi:activator of HSP90 ATPase